MRSNLPKTVVFAVVFAAAAVAAYAQQPAAASKTLRISDMPKLSKQHVLKKQPEVQYRSADIRPSSTKPRDWAYFEFEYETAKGKATDPKWIDDLAVTYYVMTQGIDDQGAKEFNFFTTTVHYADVARGQKHRAAVVLPPVAMDRFGVPVAFSVEISDGEGDPVTKTVTGIQSIPEDWWTNEKVTEKLVTRDGYLVDRSKTLFQFVNPDDYEAVR